MRKRINILMIILCAAFAIALAAAGSVQAKEANPFEVSAPVTKPGKVSAARVVNMKISSLTTTSVSVEFDNSSSYKDIQLFNFKNKKVATYHAYYYCTMSLSKNRVYYIRFRANSYSPWSKKLAVCTAIPKFSVKRGPKVKFKAPKTKKVKKFFLYMSTSSGSGYKKIKTLKPKKSVTIRRFRGAKLVKYKNYYYRMVAVIKGGRKALCPPMYFWLYSKYY